MLDVLFTCIIDMDLLLFQLGRKLNEVDSKGDLPLDIALRKKMTSITRALTEHCVNLDAKDNKGYTLLHRAVQRGKSNTIYIIV